MLQVCAGVDDTLCRSPTGDANTINTSLFPPPGLWYGFPPRGGIRRRSARRSFALEPTPVWPELSLTGRAPLPSRSSPMVWNDISARLFPCVSPFQLQTCPCGQLEPLCVVLIAVTRNSIFRSGQFCWAPIRWQRLGTPYVLGWGYIIEG